MKFVENCQMSFGGWWKHITICLALVIPSLSILVNGCLPTSSTRSSMQDFWQLLAPGFSSPHLRSAMRQRTCHSTPATPQQTRGRDFPLLVLCNQLPQCMQLPLSRAGCPLQPLLLRTSSRPWRATLWEEHRSITMWKSMTHMLSEPRNPNNRVTSFLWIWFKLISMA